MASTIYTIRHEDHVGPADHIADGEGPNEGKRMFYCFSCESEVIDPEVISQADEATVTFRVSTLRSFLYGLSVSRTHEGRLRFADGCVGGLLRFATDTGAELSTHQCGACERQVVIGSEARA